MMVGKLIRILIITAIITSCGMYRTVYVPHGDAVKLRETVKDVKVWVKTKDGEVVPGKMNLPEGWFCLPLDEEANAVP